LLKLQDLTLDTLKKDSVYTFILGCNEFSIFPLKKEYLILRSIFTENNPATDSPIKDVDPLLKLRDAALKPFVVNLDDK
jgi:hypothetical protein